MCAHGGFGGSQCSVTRRHTLLPSLLRLGAFDCHSTSSCVRRGTETVPSER